jgi:hypothetical protein
MGHLELDCRDPGRLVSILLDGSRAPWCEGRLESPTGSIVLTSCRSTRAGFQPKLRVNLVRRRRTPFTIAKTTNVP